ncbi:electron transfer flavoprotein subunit alpha/FixB family protein [Cobetia sp. 10Alg 146]|uniref:electron transfer flavoprotein subunit alpha/FixB family protein n=1 Tax=Cobetia sp. 10Alg 146 TaxID=3040019 RepID=UPI002448DBDD|nr:electron transfer flavoprotein subunit alpha/FixB family protein [Cobetia sp. 10Alg 146]MDH2292487.1 electron transfer flavoprotein subunit alpha/FixB family protein [Cobetia sp. 10Alg 146]
MTIPVDPQATEHPHPSEHPHASEREPLPRRDPRLEQQARNRLHPQHLSALQALGRGAATPQERWMGPKGVMRRNPHVGHFIAANGRKRIDRSGRSGPAAAGAGQAAVVAKARVLPLVEIASPAFLIAVVPDMTGGRLSSHDRDVLGLARQIADADPAHLGAVLAVTFGTLREEGDAADSVGLGAAGADRWLHFADSVHDGYAPLAQLAELEAIDTRLAPRLWLLPESRTGGGERGRRLGARLLCTGDALARPSGNVYQLEGELAAIGRGELAEVNVTGRSGNGQQDLTRALTRILLCEAECAEPVEDVRHAALPLEWEADSTARAMPDVIEDLGPVAVDPSAIALGEAEFILSAGNGIRDWDGFHRAASLLGATEGASRVAVDDGFMPRARQVGATGTWVTARVYVAVGISGAIQHLQGIQRCDKVVAINLDGGCDMVKRADLSVIGDAGAILASLCQQLEAERGAGGDAQAAGGASAAGQSSTAPAMSSNPSSSPSSATLAADAA